MVVNAVGSNNSSRSNICLKGTFVLYTVTKDLEFVLTLMGLRRQAERARAIGALRLARHEGHDGRLVGHAPYVAHGPRNAIRTGSLIGRHLCSVYNHSSCYIRK